jgi:hypothetical protein
MAHHQISWLLANQLSAATRDTGLHTVVNPALPLSPARTPPVAVGRFGPTTEIVLVADVAASPADVAPYAEAGIDWCLLATPGSPTDPSVTLHLLRREGTAYIRHTTARPGQILTSRAPFPLTIASNRGLRHD